MGLDDFGWDYPAPRRHRGVRVVVLSVFWLGVASAAVTLGWGIAESLRSVP